MNSPAHVVLWVLVAIHPGWARAQEEKLDGARIEAITKLKGAYNEAEGVFKVTAPRADVKVAVDGWAMPPFMGLTSWAAFQKGKKAQAMVMGDLVLFQDEVNPVMSALLDAGLTVTALHNHFFYDEPKVCFMHIGGEGKTEELAAGVRRALDVVKEIRDAAPRPDTGFQAKEVPATSSIGAGPIEEIVGAKGQAKDGMLKIVIGRKVQAACGCDVGKEMGVNTWAAFAGADDNALVDGDFAVTGEELQAVLKSLRRSKINIVAIHSHMTMETPPMIFLHYWGRGAATDLARGVRAALDAQAGKPEAKLKEDFEKDNPKWSFTTGTWQRRASGGSQVLAQTATTQPWAVALLEERSFADIDLSVRFRPISGREDQSGGLIFRAKDASNYFLVRANSLEGNARLYTMIDGKREQIDSAKVAAPVAGEWHTLRVVAKGPRIQAWLDGTATLDHEDKTYSEGWVGLWTKADSVTEFDDLEAIAIPAK